MVSVRDSRSPDSNRILLPIAVVLQRPKTRLKSTCSAQGKKGEKEKETRNTRETRSRSRDAIRYMENVAMRAASRVGIVILHGCAR